MGTQADLRNAILSRLGSLDGGAAPDAADAVRVESEMRSVLAALFADNLLPFDIEGTIPDAYMTPLSFLVAQELVVDFGASERADAIAQGAERARRRLYVLKAKPVSTLPVVSDYF